MWTKKKVWTTFPTLAVTSGTDAIPTDGHVRAAEALDTHTPTATIVVHWRDRAVEYTVPLMSVVRALNSKKPLKLTERA